MRQGHDTAERFGGLLQSTPMTAAEQLARMLRWDERPWDIPGCPVVFQPRTGRDSRAMKVAGARVTLWLPVRPCLCERGCVVTSVWFAGEPLGRSEFQAHGDELVVRLPLPHQWDGTLYGEGSA